MATLDYKISSWSKDENRYSVHVKLYRGSVTTEQEPDRDGNLVDVTRYRRSALVAQRRFTFTSDLTSNQLRKWLNNKIKTRVEAMGHTIADFQLNTAEDDAEVAGYPISNLTDNAV
jgi:hypothetical protein